MPPETNTDATNDPGEGDDTGDTSPSPENGTQTPNSEAARYRVQLRAAEQERDTAHEQLATMRTAEAERLASTAERGPRLHAGDELWTNGATISDVLGDDGTVSADKVRELIETVTTDRPHLRADYGPQQPRSDHSQGKGNTGNGNGAQTWGGFLQNGSNTRKTVAATDSRGLADGLRGLFPTE